MFVFLLATLAAPPAAGEWTFVDEPALAGRSVLTFRTADLGDVPARALDAADRPPAGAKYGVVGVGPGGNHRLGVVWHAATGTLWFDADGDGRFSKAERHTLGDTPVAAAVAIPFEAGAKKDRTVLIRKRGDGVAWAVRGYTTGTLAVGGKVVTAALTDGDADGCFARTGRDRLWLDLDGDGRFDPLTEQYPVGTAVPAGGRPTLVRPRPDGLAATAHERPTETGSLRIDVDRLPRSAVSDLRAKVVSDFGELVELTAEGKAKPLPVGKYRVESVDFTLTGTDGKRWRYSFWAGDTASHDVEVRTDRETAHRLVTGPKVTVAFDAAAAAARGGAVVVQADVVAGGLRLIQCEVLERFADNGAGVTADVALTEPGSVTVDKCESGFQCGRLCAQPVRVPPTVTVEGLEVKVTFPTGPLAGDLTGTKDVPAPPRK